MKMTFVLLFTLCFMPLVGSSMPGAIHTNKPDSLPGKVLIINSFDANAMKARKNKKELFADLAENLKQLLYEGVQKAYLIDAGLLPELFPGTYNDSLVFSVMRNNGATKAIIIRNIDVHFEQTGVEVTGTKNNKTRTASFDICANVLYEFYTTATKISSERPYCEFYTKRSVISGLLAAGPDVVGKKKDAFKMMEINARHYISEMADELIR